MDELCLRTTSRSLETVADRNAYMAARSGTPNSRNLPPSSHARRRTQGAQAARHEVSAHESARNEVVRQQEALRLNQSASRTCLCDFENISTYFFQYCIAVHCGKVWCPVMSNILSFVLRKSCIAGTALNQNCQSRVSASAAFYMTFCDPKQHVIVES